MRGGIEPVADRSDLVFDLCGRHCSTGDGPGKLHGLSGRFSAASDGSDELYLLRCWDESESNGPVDLCCLFTRLSAATDWPSIVRWLHRFDR